jgi:hypothetical protein
MNNAITHPATGDTTPGTKCQRTATSTVSVTPGGMVQNLTLALQAATDAKAAAAAAAANGMDIEAEMPPSNDETETKDTAKPEPVPPGCSLLSLPLTFNSFADTISKKVTAF